MRTDLGEFSYMPLMSPFTMRMYVLLLLRSFTLCAGVDKRLVESVIPHHNCVDLDQIYIYI